MLQRNTHPTNRRRTNYTIIIEVCPAVCIMQHLSCWRQRITGLHRLAAHHYRRILVMHTMKMCDPFVDISIVFMIQSTLVSGLLCLSLPVLGTVQGIVRESRLFANIFGNERLVSMLYLSTCEMECLCYVFLHITSTHTFPKCSH